MQTNKEFSVLNNVPAELSSEITDFAMFTIELDNVMIEAGRDENGKRIMKPAFPHKRGNLWDIVPITETRDFGGALSRKVGVTEKRKTEAEIKEENIARYAKMVEAGLADTEEGLFGNLPEEEYTKDKKFFAVDCELVGGKCRRRGGVKNHEGFEALVDG